MSNRQAPKQAARGQKSIAAFFSCAPRSSPAQTQTDTVAGRDADAAAAARSAAPRDDSDEVELVPTKRKRCEAEEEEGGAEAVPPASIARTSRQLSIKGASEAVDAAPRPIVSAPDGSSGVSAGSGRAAQAPAPRDRDPARTALAQTKFALRRKSVQEFEPTDRATGKNSFTPLEQQVLTLKKKHQGKVLIVECGYKFRFFGEDAELAARELNIYAYQDHNFKTASIPVHRVHIYVRRLVRKGHCVAIARQTETAALKAASESRSKVFQRQVTGIYTPATLEAGCEEDTGEGATEAGGQGVDTRASYLMCVVAQPGAVSHSTAGAGCLDTPVAFVCMEPSLASIFWGVCDGAGGSDLLQSALMYFAPREVLVAAGATGEGVADARAAAEGATGAGTSMQRLLRAFAESHAGTLLHNVDRPAAAADMQRQEIQRLCAGETAAEQWDEPLRNLDGGVLTALLAAFRYLRTLGLELWNEHGLQLRNVLEPGHMTLSANAMAQLSVLEGDDGKEKGSLLGLVNHTRSRSGRQLLREWLSHPLTSAEGIRERQDAVVALVEDPDLQARVREVVRGAPDLDRMIGRMFLARASPLEFCKAMAFFVSLPEALLGSTAAPAEGDELAVGRSSILLQEKLRTAAAARVVQAARQQLDVLDAAAAKENDMIRVFACPDRFTKVFERKAALAAAEAALNTLLPQLAKEAGVYKVTYTSIQHQGDHLIELPADCKVPKTWVKVCATKKVNRFRPPQVLQAMQERDMAHERLQAACSAAWKQFASDFAPHCPAFRAAAAALATLDCLSSAAVAAMLPGWTQPHVLPDEAPPGVDIEQGRAPLLEDVLSQGAVPNDVHLGDASQRIMVLTGPNMGGKSSYICTVAQLAVLAQAGLHVPAAAMRLRPLDAVITRMGANDSILQHRSTFMEELLEAAHVLRSATASSLVVVDELGRGTATHDGVAIAVAVLDWLVRRSACLGLFVTHYPEVCCAAEKLLPAAQCFRMGYERRGTWKAGLKAPGSSPQGNTAAVPTAPMRGPPAAATADVSEPNDTAVQEIPRIIFRYTVERGAADMSFGFNVALLAGLPFSVVQRAQQVAQHMLVRRKQPCAQGGGHEALGGGLDAQDDALARVTAAEAAALRCLGDVLNLTSAGAQGVLASVQACMAAQRGNAD